MTPARMYLLSGFLGSGKTTVLNGVLRSLAGRRVGVIVNEWGSIAVDNRLLLDPSGLGVVELAGGQIFCSCVSGSFIAAAARLASFDLDYLLIETSGLAKPSALKTIVSEAEKRSEGKLSYRGMVCVVDATRFLALRQAAAVVDEQVVYSDRFVVTKTDLADPRTVREVYATLERFSPGAKTTEAVNGAVDASLLDEVEVRPEPKGESRFRGWGTAGRPGSTTVVPEGPVPEKRLSAFLSELTPSSYRVKGFVRLEEGGRIVLVDGVGDDARLREDPAYASLAESAVGLAFIWKGTDADASDRVRRTWERLVGTAARVS